MGPEGQREVACRAVDRSVGSRVAGSRRVLRGVKSRLPARSMSDSEDDGVRLVTSRDLMTDGREDGLDEGWNLIVWRASKLVARR